MSEAFTGDRVAEQVERLAHHALRGEVWDKALAYCRQAGDKAMARSAHREAVGYFEQALSVLPHLPESVTHVSKPLISGSPCVRPLLRSAILGVSWPIYARPRPLPRPSTTRVDWDGSRSFCHTIAA